MRKMRRLFLGVILTLLFYSPLQAQIGSFSIPTTLTPGWMSALLTVTSVAATPGEPASVNPYGLGNSIFRKEISSPPASGSFDNGAGITFNITFTNGSAGDVTSFHIIDSGIVSPEVNGCTLSYRSTDSSVSATPDSMGYGYTVNSLRVGASFTMIVTCARIGVCSNFDNTAEFRNSAGEALGRVTITVPVNPMSPACLSTSGTGGCTDALSGAGCLTPGGTTTTTSMCVEEEGLLRAIEVSRVPSTYPDHTSFTNAYLLRRWSGMPMAFTEDAFTVYKNFCDCLHDVGTSEYPCTGNPSPTASGGSGGMDTGGSSGSGGMGTGGSSGSGGGTGGANPSMDQACPADYVTVGKICYKKFLQPSTPTTFALGEQVRYAIDVMNN